MPKEPRDRARRRSSSPRRRRSSERRRSRSPGGRPGHRRESSSHDRRRGYSRSPHRGPSRRSPSPRRRPSPHRRSPSPRRRSSPHRRSPSPRRHASPHRRSPSPRRRPSPHRRSPSPREHRRSSPSLPPRGRSPSPSRPSSPGPQVGSHPSPGLQGQRRSPGPPPSSHRSPSPRGRGPPNPVARRPQSPGIRRSMSPRGQKRHASPPPKRWTPSPQRRQRSASPSHKYARRPGSPRGRGRQEMERREEGGWEMARRRSPMHKRSFSEERSLQRQQRFTPSPDTRQSRHQRREPELAGSCDRSRDADRHAAEVGESIRTYMQEAAQDRSRNRDDYYDSPRYSQREPHIESLSDRFGPKDSRPFIPEENIQVGIRRNIPGNEPPIIRREIDPSQVFIVRSKEEGQKPFFAREEFKEREVEEIEERRVITVVPEERHHRPREDERIVEASHRRPQKVHVELRWPEEDRLSQTRPDNSQFSGIRIERSYGGARHIRDRRSPERGRHALDHRSPERDSMRSSYLHQDRERDRPEPRPGDLRYNLSRRREEQEGSFDARQKIRSRIGSSKMEDDRGRGQSDRYFDRQGFRDERRGFDSRRGGGRDQGGERGELPDFKKRENRYSYEEWRDKPEMIPKADSYYEHDNRGEMDYWRRDRGRGRGRGRFNRGRGGFRGRGGYRPDYRGTSSSSPFGKWTHDKFKELEQEEDKEPTSTTK